MSQAIEGTAAEILSGANFATVVTPRKDGSLRAVVVWIHTKDGLINLNSAKGRAWPTRLENHGKALIVVPNHANPYQYVEIDASVEEITDEGAEDQIEAMSHKYLGTPYPFRQPGEERISFNLRADRVRVQG